MIIYIIAAILFYLMFSYKTQTETFTGDSEQEAIGRDILAFLKPDTTYSQFLDFIGKKNNKSYKLLKQESFYEMKFLKKSNELTKTNIMQFMDDL